MNTKNCRLIAEIGCNHCGQLETAIKMIGVAAWAEVSAVKLQLRDVLHPPLSWDRPYDDPHSYGATYREHRRALELEKGEYASLVIQAKEHGLECGASVWDIMSVKTALDIGVDWIKIPSALVTTLDVISAVAQCGKPIVLSTGMSTIEEIRQAVAMLTCARLTILHCTSSYPCANGDVNLRAMREIKELFPWADVGISGHWSGIQIDAAAVAMGACMIERHFTLDRELKGTDHSASLAPDGLKRWVRDIRIVEKAMGSHEIQVLPCERSARKKLRADSQEEDIKGEKKKQIAKNFWRKALDRDWSIDTQCICGKSSDHILAHEDRFGVPIPTVVCRFCGTVRRTKALNRSGLEQFYRGTYRQLHSGAGPLSVRIQRDTDKALYLSQNILAGAQVSSIGEIGAGSGYTSIELGWLTEADSVYPCDLDPPSSDVMRGGVEVLPGDLDLLLSVHVLEHQSDPVTVLRKWAEKVRDGGLILTVVPDMFRAHHHYTVSSSKDVGKWFTLAHTWDWTAQTAMLAHMAAGLQVIDLKKAPPGTLASVGSICVLCRKKYISDYVESYVDTWSGR